MIYELVYLWYMWYVSTSDTCTLYRAPACIAHVIVYLYYVHV